MLSAASLASFPIIFPRPPPLPLFSEWCFPLMWDVCAAKKKIEKKSGKKPQKNTKKNKFNRM